MAVAPPLFLLDSKNKVVTHVEQIHNVDRRFDAKPKGRRGQVPVKLEENIVVAINALNPDANLDNQATILVEKSIVVAEKRRFAVTISVDIWITDKRNRIPASNEEEISSRGSGFADGELRPWTPLTGWAPFEMIRSKPSGLPHRPLTPRMEPC